MFHSSIGFWYHWQLSTGEWALPGTIVGFKNQQNKNEEIISCELLFGPYPHKSFLPGSFNRKAPNNQNDLASLLFQVWTSAHINLLLWMKRKNTKFSGTATGKKFSKVARNGQMKLEIVQQQLVSLNRPRTEKVVSSRTEKKNEKNWREKKSSEKFFLLFKMMMTQHLFWNGGIFFGNLGCSRN